MAARIMICDEDEGFRDRYSDILNANGFEVLHAVNGMDCINKLRNTKVDLVLMDLMMPMMSGVDTIRYIRGDDGMKDQNIVVITVLKMDEGLDHHLSELDVHNILIKPIDTWVLLKMVNKVLGRKHPIFN
ncbi:MAG: response regulator [Candidatus Altiarchaeota archaeon]